MVEAIWGQDKSAAQIASILRELHGARELALVTRVSPAKVRAVERELGRLDPDLGMPLHHHPEARCLVSPCLPPAIPALGEVVVLADIKAQAQKVQAVVVLPIILLQQEELGKQDKDLQVEQDLLIRLQLLAEAVEAVLAQLEQMEQLQVVRVAV